MTSTDRAKAETIIRKQAVYLFKIQSLVDGREQFEKLLEDISRYGKIRPGVVLDILFPVKNHHQPN